MFICLLYVLETERKALKLETPKFPERRQIIKTVTESKKTHFPFVTLSGKCLKENWKMDVSVENKLTFK